jgi:hypothetical protein
MRKGKKIHIVQFLIIVDFYFLFFDLSLSDRSRIVLRRYHGVTGNTGTAVDKMTIYGRRTL